MTHKDNCDIDAKSLFSELQILQVALPEEASEPDNSWDSLRILKYVKRMDILPNVVIAYRILLTIPINVATAERSFSKLKLIKSYLRTTMSQDRLNALAIMSIERGLLKTVDVDDIIDEFASKTARRSHIKKSIDICRLEEQG